MKPDIKAIKERLKKVTNADDAYEEINASMESVRYVPDLLDYIADLEAVVDVVRKRDKKIKEWRKVVTEIDYLDDGYQQKITEVNKEISRLDNELEKDLAKLDGDKDG